MRYSKQDWALIGENIRHARLHANLTQAQLAMACGMGRTEICKVELGRRQLKIAELIDIAKTTNFEVDNLLEGVSKKIIKPAQVKEVKEVKEGEADKKHDRLEFSRLSKSEWVEFGRNLKERRLDAGLSQTDLVKKIGASEGLRGQKISALERGDVTAGEYIVKYLPKILEVLGATIESLLPSTVTPEEVTTPRTHAISPVEASKSDPTEFGQQVRKAREAKGWSQAKLAKMADISRSYLWDIEMGCKFTLSWEKKERLILLLGLNEGMLGLPAGLNTFAEEYDLSSEEVSMLSQINYQGMQPTTAEGWKLLYKAIRLAIVD